VEAASQKGVCFWPLFNFRDNCPSGSENEFVDVDSFSDVAPEVRKEAVPDAAAGPAAEAKVAVPTEAPVVAEASAADVSQPALSRDEASPEFTKELELTVQRGENPTEHAPLVEVREVVPEDQTPSPSLAAFNKSFGTSHRGKLLSVGFETTGVGSKTSKILTLWKSSMTIDESGGESSGQPERAAAGSEKRAHPTSEGTPSPQVRASSGSAKQVTMQQFSKQGSSFLSTFSCLSLILGFLSEALILNFSEFKDLLHSYPPSKLARFQEDYALKHSKMNKQLSQKSKELKRSFALAQSANVELEKKVAELAEALKASRMKRDSWNRLLSNRRRNLKRFKSPTKMTLV
jgi:hypothetical protein